MTKKISLCITTYNRSDLTIRAFSQVLEHPSIDEVVIVDDNSSQEHFDKLVSLLSSIKNPKIKLFRNVKNLDCYQNKKRSVELAKNEWCIIFDSDNVMWKDYIDALNNLAEWVLDCIYAPFFATPFFDYSSLVGNISIDNVSEITKNPKFSAMINTCNYFVNREQYLKIHKSDIDPHAADTAYFNLCWIKAGNTIKVVSGLKYQHDVHDGSHYKEHNHKSNGLFEEIMGEFKSITEGREEEIEQRQYTKPFEMIPQKFPTEDRNLSDEEENHAKEYIEKQMGLPVTPQTLYVASKPDTSMKSVVTFKPMGRMGNYMWELSAAFAYAKKHGLNFSVPNKTNDAQWNPIYFTDKASPLMDLYRANGVIKIEEKTYFKFDELPYEKDWEFSKTIELEGYFQNPKYFAEYRKEILEFLELPWELKKDTVAIQVRRTDYLIHHDKHPAFSDEYMCNAMAYFAAKGFTKFKVFSDDIAWCKDYFGDKKFSKFTIDFSEGKKELEDLIGISECAHHINSSSTFSWWGAWMNKSEEKIIVTPKIWLLHKHSNEFTNEIIPSGWVRM